MILKLDYIQYYLIGAGFKLFTCLIRGVSWSDRLNQNFEKKETRDASKIIMRMALDFHLGSKTLNIRKYLTKN